MGGLRALWGSTPRGAGVGGDFSESVGLWGPEAQAGPD